MLSGVHLAGIHQEDGPLPAHHSAEEILAHPRFPFARQEFVKAVLANYEHNPFLGRLLLETGRTVLFILTMCFHARHDRGDRTTWPTLGLLVESMVAHGVASPRRVSDMVRRMITTGYLEQRAPPQDRRARIPTPTAKMIAHDQDFLVSHYLPLQMLFPEPGYGPIMERDPSFQLTQRLVSAGLFARGARIMAGNPIMTLFMGRDAGAMILIKLMQMVGPTGEATPLELSFAEIGARFGVSRTHVRRLLKDAEEQGLVRLTRGNGQVVEAMPALVQAFDRFVAESMAGHDLIYNLALARPVDVTQTPKIQPPANYQSLGSGRPSSRIEAALNCCS